MSPSSRWCDVVVGVQWRRALQLLCRTPDLTSPPAPPAPSSSGAPAPQPACPPGGGSTNGNCPGQQNAAKDCRNDHNCCDPGFACYRKNDGYSDCRTIKSCRLGEVFQNDEQRFRTLWDCTYLGGECDVAEQQRVNVFQASKLDSGGKALVHANFR